MLCLHECGQLYMNGDSISILKSTDIVGMIFVDLDRCHRMHPESLGNNLGIIFQLLV